MLAVMPAPGVAGQAAGRGGEVRRASSVRARQAPDHAGMCCVCCALEPVRSLTLPTPCGAGPQAAAASGALTCGELPRGGGCIEAGLAPARKREVRALRRSEQHGRLSTHSVLWLQQGGDVDVLAQWQ